MKVLSWDEFQEELKKDSSSPILFLHAKWNKIKQEIEKLKPYAANDYQVRMKIRKLKDEASVFKFADEKIRILGYPPERALAEMERDREQYRQLWNY